MILLYPQYAANTGVGVDVKCPNGSASHTTSRQQSDPSRGLSACTDIDRQKENI